LTHDAGCGACADFSPKITPAALTLLKKYRAFSIAAASVPLR
jgi:hypothetical protein